MLLKFKLLEVQRQPMDDFLRWAGATPYIALIRKRFFNDVALDDWLRALCAQLVAAGVARREGAWLVNA